MLQSTKTRNDLIVTINTNHDLDRTGCKAEMAGLRTFKIMRNGRFQGLWRQTVGSFDWYPAGYNLPTYRASTADDVLRHTISTFTSPMAA